MITVLTATIPGREDYLERAMASVRNQKTHTPFVKQHLVIATDGAMGYANHGRDIWDTSHHNTEHAYNLLAHAVDTEWMHLLDDDNYFLPHHMETIRGHLEHADVCYSRAVVENNTNPNHTRSHANLNGASRDDILRLFANGNVLDQSCAIRTEMWRKVGGFQYDSNTRGRWPDQDLWYRLADVGARFVHIPEDTWVFDLRGRQV